MWKKVHASLYFTAGLIKRVYIVRVVDERRGTMGLNLLPNFQISGGLKGFLLNEGCWEKRGGVNCFKELEFLHEKQTKIWNI